MPKSKASGPQVGHYFMAEFNGTPSVRIFEFDRDFAPVNEFSVSGVASLLPHAAGTLLQTEVDALSRLTTNTEHPYVVIIGGAKVSDKIKVIENLLPKVDRMLIGGGMMFTFIKALGGQIGNSLVEDDQLEYARGLLDQYGDKLMLPTDAVAADRFDAAAQS